MVQQSFTPAPEKPALNLVTTGPEGEGRVCENLLTLTTSGFQVQLIRAALFESVCLYGLAPETLRSLYAQLEQVGLISEPERVVLAVQASVWRCENEFYEIDPAIVANREQDRELMALCPMLETIEQRPRSTWRDLAEELEVPEHFVDRLIQLHESCDQRSYELQVASFLLIAPDLAHLIPSWRFLTAAKLVGAQDEEIRRDLVKWLKAEQAERGGRFYFVQEKADTK